jgi:hypothetical protein
MPFSKKNIYIKVVVVVVVVVAAAARPAIVTENV